MSALVSAEEGRLAGLIRQLPPAPEQWVEFAVALPATGHALDQILALAEADAEFQAELMTDLERAVQRAGHDPDPRLVRRLRHSLERED